MTYLLLLAVILLVVGLISLDLDRRNRRDWINQLETGVDELHTKLSKAHLDYAHLSSASINMAIELDKQAGSASSVQYDA